LNLKIKERKPSGDFLSAYKKLLEESPHTTPFHTLEFLEVFKKWIPNSSVFFLTVERGEELVGAMPVIEKRLGLARFFYSLPYGSFGGFIAKEDLDPVKEWSSKISPLLGMTEVVDLWSTLSPSPHFETHREVCHILRLPDSYEEVFRRVYDKKQRNMVRAPLKRGLVDYPMETEEDLKAFYPLYRELDIRKGTKPLSYEQLKIAMEILLPAGIWRGFLAKVNGEVVGGIISLFHRKMTVAFLAGYRFEARELKVMTFLVDRALRDSIEMKSELFNLGTTPGGDPGVVKFKESFGTHPLYFPVHTRKSVVYRIFARIKGK